MMSLGASSEFQRLLQKPAKSLNDVSTTSAAFRPTQLILWTRSVHLFLFVKKQKRLLLTVSMVCQRCCFKSPDLRIRYISGASGARRDQHINKTGSCQFSLASLGHTRVELGKCQ